MVSCPKYVPLPNSRKCQHYYDEFPDLAGACDRDDEFMCVEWLRVYPSGWEDKDGRVHPVDRNGLVHITRRTSW